MEVFINLHHLCAKIGDNGCGLIGCNTWSLVSAYMDNVKAKDVLSTLMNFSNREEQISYHPLHK